MGGHLFTALCCCAEQVQHREQQYAMLQWQEAVRSVGLQAISALCGSFSPNTASDGLPAFLNHQVQSLAKAAIALPLRTSLQKHDGLDMPCGYV